jgi:ABC-type lipoprotein release transport system permease subunit
VVAIPARGEVRRIAYPVRWPMGLPFPARNLVHRWRGMLGMMLGVGIALGIVMTSLGTTAGSIESYSADYKRSATALYVVTDGGILVPVLPGDSPGTIKNARHVLSQIRGLPGVDAVLGVMSWPMVREREGPRRQDDPVEQITTVGVDGDPADIAGGLVVEQGRWVRRLNEVFLGSKLSREKGLPVGSSIRLNGRDFTVVGTGKLRGVSTFGADALAYMDYRAFRERVDLGDVVSVITVATGQPEEVRQRILELGTLEAFTPAQLIRRSEEVNAASLVFTGVFGLLAMTIGGLFVTNMLSRSVAERRLEFATLRAIGIPRRTILASVAAEAVLISLAAALVGVALSLVLGFWLNAWASSEYGIEAIFVAGPGLFVFVFALSLVLAVISGLFPARQATRVDPIDVLREA